MTAEDLLYKQYLTFFFNKIKYLNLLKKENNINLVQNYFELESKSNSKLKIPTENEINKLKNICKNNYFKLISKFEIDKLRNIDSLPVFFFYQGNINLINQNLISFTGSRIPSKNSILIASKISNLISSLSCKSVAGFAKGIDQIVHKNSIKGGTVAVLGSGLLNIYPKESKILFEEILENKGLILSQFHPEEKPLPKNFIERNKTIVLLSNLLIMIECNLKSGTYMTVNFANKLNKKIIFPDIQKNGNLDFKERNIGKTFNEKKIRNC